MSAPSGRSSSSTVRCLSCVFVAITVAITIAITITMGCGGGPAAALAELDDSRRLAADLRVQFNKADDASNRAVMADTDEASVAFARDAEKSVQFVDGDVAALTPLLHNLRLPSEIQALEVFAKHFAQYRELDRSILELAVENTNLKAQRLSFGAARQAADAFRDSLLAVPAALAAKDHCRSDELVAKATLAVREIQVLQAPHIAESDDAAMTGMEKEMAQLEASARDDVKALGELSPASARPAVATALSALDRFKDISGQIVTLSRRNTNVRSLELALRTKPALTAACDDSVVALETALAKEGSKATR